jgi:ABC-type sulfate transport system permease component
MNPVANKHHEVIIPLLAYDLSTASILSKIALSCFGYTIVVGLEINDPTMRSSVMIVQGFFSNSRFWACRSSDCR